MRNLLTGSFVSLTAAGVLLWQFGALPNALKWPARIVIALLLLNGARRFVPAWRSLAENLARAATLAGRAAASAIGRHATAIKRVELATAVVLVLATAPGILSVASAMSRDSLITDEITSVRRYSGRGPLETMTRYPRANNHVFFNLINSVLPGAGSFDPLRARIVSFAAAAVFLILPLALFWPRRHYAAGALLFAWLGANHDLIAFHLQGRGYGLLALIAFFSAALFMKFRAAQLGTVALLGVSAVIGTYTLPFYLLFGGWLLIMLYLERPSVALFLAGVWALMAVVLLYLPLAGDFLKTAGSYTEDYGFSLNNLASLNRAIGQFWPIPPKVSPLAEAALALTAFFLIAGMAGLHPRTRRRALALGSAVAAFFAFAFFYDTVPERVVAFLVAPTALAFTLMGVDLFGSGRLRPAGLVAAPLACLAGVLAVLSLPDPSKELPDENWQELGQCIQLLFSQETFVWTDRYDNNVAAYLPETYRVEEGGETPVAELTAGRAVVHDSGHNATSRVRTLDPAVFPIGTQRIVFPLKGGQSVLYWLPRRAPFFIAPGTDLAPVYTLGAEAFEDVHGAALRREDGWNAARITIDNRSLPQHRMAILGEWLLLRAPPSGQSIRIELPEGQAATPLEFVPGL